MRPDVFIDEESSVDGRPVSATASAVNSLDSLYKSATITTNDDQWRAAGLQAANGTNFAGSTNSLNAITSSQIADSHNKPSPPTATVSSTTSAASVANSNTDVDDGEPHTIPFPGLQGRSTPSVANVAQRGMLQANMDRVLTLPPDKLAELLSRLDTQTILLALAGATTQFMKRFRGMLVPEDAKVLDERIRQVGPITLRQIDEAQQRLVDCYFSFVSPVAKQRAA
jgi:hypothetical protein